MADLGSIDLGGIIKSLGENPELLTRAIEMASQLKTSGLLEGMSGTGAGAGGHDGAPDNDRDDRDRQWETGRENDDASSPYGRNDYGNENGRDKDRDGDGDRHEDRDRDRDREKGYKGTVPGAGAENDRRKLLQALKPFLGADRREKVDLLLNIMQFLSLAGNMGFVTPKSR